MEQMLTITDGGLARRFVLKKRLQLSHSELRMSLKAGTVE